MRDSYRALREQQLWKKMIQDVRLLLEILTPPCDANLRRSCARCAAITPRANIMASGLAKVAKDFSNGRCKRVRSMSV